MQREISDDVQIGKSVTPFKSVRKQAAIVKAASDFKNANLKVKKIRKLIEQRIYDVDIACYMSQTLDLNFQGMIEKIKTIEQPADSTYKDKETLDFELILDKNYYTNQKSLHICFPIKLKILFNATQILNLNLNPVNSLFTH